MTMADKAPDETTRIRAVLRDHPQGLSIKEIAAEVGMSRNSVAKYLDVLTATGQLELRHVGNAKLFTLSQRVPVDNIINYASELIIVLDRTLRIIEASDSLCLFARAPRETILRTRLSAPPTLILTVEEENELPALVGGGLSWKKQIRLVRGADEIFLDGRFIPTMLRNGDPGITLILEDTTQRRRAERAMQERDRLLHTIFQIPSVPRFFIDRNHKVVFWDRALEIMTGIKSEDIVGTDQQWRCFYPEKRPCLADLLVEGDLARIPELYGPACITSPSGDRAYELTAFFPHAGNGGRWLHVTASVMRDTAGNLTGAMETLEDVTEKKQREFVVEG